MDPLDYLRGLTHRWKIIGTCVLIALPVGWFLSPETLGSAPPTTAFKATTHLFAVQTSTSVKTPRDTLQEVATRATLGEVPKRAAEALEFEGGVNGFLEQISVVSDDTTGNLLSIIATAPTARRAELMANTLAYELLGALDREMQSRIEALEQDLAQVERRISRLDGGGGDASSQGNKGGGGDAGSDLAKQRRELAQELAELRSSLRDGSAGIEVLQPASAQQVTTDTGLQVPRSRRVRLLLAAMIGLILGVAAALIRERLDPRIRDREQAEDAFRLPVLAEIPRIPRRRRSSRVATVAQGTVASNAFQLLAAALRFVRSPVTSDAGSDIAQAAGRTILVTGTAQSEWKSTTVVNLAAAFAEFGNRVIVLCCDPGRPTLHDAFGVEQGPGLSEVLNETGHAGLSQVLHRTMLDRVEVIPVGKAPRASAAVLSSTEMHGLLLEARSAADIVLIDTAPILVSSDWTHLLPEVDAVVLVARTGATRWASAERAAGILDMLQAPVVGIALNGVTASSMRRGHGYRHDGDARRGGADSTSEAATEQTIPPAISNLPAVVGKPPTQGGDRSSLVAGNGAKEELVVTSDLAEVAEALGQGKRVRLKHEGRSGSFGFLEVAAVTSSQPTGENPTEDRAIGDEPTDDDPPPRIIGKDPESVRASVDQP